jgi:hypothetical protein
MGFFSVPSGPEAEAPGLVFSATYPWGGPPVNSRKFIIFLSIVKIAWFFKGLNPTIQDGVYKGSGT